MFNLFRVHCAQSDCDAGLVIDRKHIGNFEGRDWHCADHARQLSRAGAAA